MSVPQEQLVVVKAKGQQRKVDDRKLMIEEIESPNAHIVLKGPKLQRT